uniref:Notochord granular surface n=1 Tax=Cyprinus carpio TaxID=7962 RepID=A0A8C2CTT1_CYPCA
MRLCARTTSFTMSHSPERMSSYRRHFEGGLTSSSTLQVRVCSPSPPRGAARHRSASYTRSGTMARRALSGSRKSLIQDSFIILKNLRQQLFFLQCEIEELMAQIYGSVAKVDVAFSLPDLASALKQIQAQYDSIAAQNLQEMDAWYKAKFQDLNKATSRHVDTARSIREELTAYKREIQNKQRELDALKNRNEALLLQIQEAQERHKKEEEELQIRIETLKEELKSIKGKIGLLLREYQELLNLKMSLEIEITTYRKLIEGEDSRLSSMVSGLSLMSVSAGMVSSVSGAISGAVSSAASEKMLSSSTLVDHNHHESVEEFTHEQAVEMTERKTVLIRTVKTDEDTFQRDTQERTITISGAAEEND